MLVENGQLFPLIINGEKKTTVIVDTSIFEESDYQKCIALSKDRVLYKFMFDRNTTEICNLHKIIDVDVVDYIQYGEVISIFWSRG